MTVFRFIRLVRFARCDVGFTRLFYEIIRLERSENIEGVLAKFQSEIDTALRR